MRRRAEGAPGERIGRSIIQRANPSNGRLAPAFYFSPQAAKSGVAIPASSRSRRTIGQAASSELSQSRQSPSGETFAQTRVHPGRFSMDHGTASSCVPRPITALTLLTTRPEVSLRKRDSAGRKVERAQQDHAGRLPRTLCNGYHDCSPLFPNPLVRHLKSETAYAARGPTDRPPRSWRATHFNQFPWRTAVTTTWSLGDCSVSSSSVRRSTDCTSRPITVTLSTRKTDSPLIPSVAAMASGLVPCRCTRLRRRKGRRIFANHHRPASLTFNPVVRRERPRPLVMGALRMCG